ncbi:dihydroxyacetone kinase subunit L [Bosea sp. PAMC 26642]|uniref:dihydroxyacetone kinase subunit L n=1 Tax=Bosea sp. (strain PAMC 26642) TaxID=1792307 RepID=UPI000770363A|nr:dihydroxyacetone kinase subunit L [Bosea sp. PAMC 26642]AMJ61520.1 Dak phosphatase [Bosea sp. PAMC 26642]
MGITVAMLAQAAKRAAARAVLVEDELNRADGQLGDGDTGVMLRRLFETIAAAVPDAETDLGVAFRAVAMACSSATGSSLGTLVTVSMLTLAKATKGRTDIPYAELGDLLETVRDTMLTRGGAALGDKTVIDILDAVAGAIKRRDEPAEIARRASAAASNCLDSFRQRPNRIGRARMFAEKSVGLDDPGMLAFASLLDAVAPAA